MLLHIVLFLTGFGAQTVCLTLALWIMIKLQKLDYNFPGLLGSAIIACAVDSILNLILSRWFGLFSAYICAPIFVIVLYVCLRKVTHADQVDVFFTICVGGAVKFGLYLLLTGSLMGNLRPPAEMPPDTFVTTTPPPQEQPEPAAETNPAVPSAVATNPPEQSAPVVPAALLNLTNSVVVATNLFYVIGVSQNGAKSAVTVQTGKRTYTISLGEAALTQTAKGPVSVRFKELGDGWVVLVINGEETKLPLK